MCVLKDSRDSGFFLGYRKRKKGFGNRFDVFVVLKTVCYSGICEVCLNPLWLHWNRVGFVRPRLWLFLLRWNPQIWPPLLKRPSDMVSVLAHGSQDWKKKKVMPYFCRLSNIQAEGKKCSAEKSHPRTPPPRGVFPWPLWQHITLLYRRLPTPQLFRETNKRAFKLFASLFFRAWKVICLLCQMSPLMFAPIMYGAWIEILEPSSVAYLDFVCFNYEFSI